MTPGPNGGAAPPYRVVYPEVVRAALRALGEQARRAGVALDYARALRLIDGRLRADPLGWGDPNYRLRHLGLLVCRGLHPLLYVRYAVDESRRIVHVIET